jgi:26S proteasome regulatory subunit N7
MTATTSDNEGLKKIPNIQIAQWKFLYHNGPENQKTELKKKIIAAIEKDEMGPFYVSLCEELKWPVEAALRDKLLKINEKTLKSFDDKKEDAEKNAGETEILDALIAKADYYCQIGDKVRLIDRVNFRKKLLKRTRLC